jgi:hypothetical protein
MDELLTPAKYPFFNLCVMHKLDLQALEEVASTANVHKSVVGQMFVGIPVRRADAERVLAAFSQRIGRTWTLDNVKVALQPTFAELLASHHFYVGRLAASANVKDTTIKRMLKGEAVAAWEARVVLQVVSQTMSERYTLETVDVPVINDEVQHE